MINAPFDDCKSAVLHLANSIQPCGAMLVLDLEGVIVAASANIEQWLGATPSSILGQPAHSVLPPEFTLPGADIPSQYSVNALQLQPLHHLGRELLAALHATGEYMVIEIEEAPAPGESSGNASLQLARGMADQAVTTTVDDAALALLHSLAEITTFDRLMLYQFLPDWHGKVVAEVLKPGVEGFLGLHFPAGDIPDNARRLYRLKRQRLIADVHAAPVPVLGCREGLAIDLTFSELRAVHPTHIEYLKNMGVAASFSVSLVVDGELWGLIAGHHLTPCHLSFATRQLCEQLAAVSSLHMTDLQRLAHEQIRHAYHEVRANARLALQGQEGGKRAIATQLSRFRTAFKASGAWASLDGQNYFSGELPDDNALPILHEALQNLEQGRVTGSATLLPQFEHNRSLQRLASGLLYIPLGEGDFLLLLRSEQVEYVEWAGEPTMPAEGEAAPLGPRNSFQSWREQTHGQAEPWQNADLEAASRLRRMLLEYIERAQLERMALTDPLTGLSNRTLFERKLREAITISLRDEVVSAVLMIDLDRFKPVNDRHGHAAGDALLVEVAQRLRASIRDRDIAARLGGDEFAIVLFHVARAEDVDIVAQRLLDALRKPFYVQGKNLEVSASIGIALCPQHAVDPSELLACADRALYRVKHEGRDGYRVFDKRILGEGS